MAELVDDFRMIGRALVKLRESRNLSQKQLAALCGIAQGTISNLEAGITDPKISTLLPLLDFFEVKLGDFFTEAGFTNRAYKTLTITVKAPLFSDLHGVID